MENNLFLTLATILLVPLIPAFIIYKFLPSKTAVKGPFKGLNINLTGAFGGYFLLVIIAIGLTYYSIQNKQDNKLKDAESIIVNLNDQVQDLKSTIDKEKNKYHYWKLIGQVDSRSPQMTKIFIDEENISINSVGKFKATIIAKVDDNNKLNLPGAVCFFNQMEGYSVLDLSSKDQADIDSSHKQITVKDKIKMNIPVRYIRTSDNPIREW